MSTRWYPIYQLGNPQLRIFLPNFWMKLVKPAHAQPKNVVQFITPLQMTNDDIKNYLEKIYKVKVMSVRSEIVEGELKKQPTRGYIIKDDDYRRALVTLPKDEKFEFPDVCIEKEKKSESDLKKAQEQAREGYKRFTERNKDRKGLPGWFSV